MISNLLSYTSSYFLGALHSLEPGHGKSIIALHTSKSNNFSDGLGMLFTLLITHFSLVVLLSVIFYFIPSFSQYEYINILASVLIISYGLFLLIKKSKKKDEYIGCSCSHTEEENHQKTKKEKIWLGFMAGLTPCPSVLSPIFISMSTSSFQNIFLYIIAYILGVISVFFALYMIVFLLKSKTDRLFMSLTHSFNPHIFSGALMIAIGLFYLFIHFME